MTERLSHARLEKMAPRLPCVAVVATGADATGLGGPAVCTAMRSVKSLWLQDARVSAPLICMCLGVSPGRSVVALAAVAERLIVAMSLPVCSLEK